jgi:hypothetical protein
MTRPLTRARVIIPPKMENKTESNGKQVETSQSFVVRMWQEDPGKWRGSIRHVQSEAHMGFTRVEQALRFIGQYTGGIEKRQFAQGPVTHPAWNLSLRLSRRTTKMLALAAALILLTTVGILAAGQGNIAQVLGFGH